MVQEGRKSSSTSPYLFYKTVLEQGFKDDPVVKLPKSSSSHPTQ